MLKVNSVLEKRSLFTARSTCGALRRKLSRSTGEVLVNTQALPAFLLSIALLCAIFVNYQIWKELKRVRKRLDEVERRDRAASVLLDNFGVRAVFAEMTQRFSRACALQETDRRLFYEVGGSDMAQNLWSSNVIVDCMKAEQERKLAALQVLDLKVPEDAPTYLGGV